MSILYSVGNVVEQIDTVKRFTFQAILNAPVAVDTFFLLRFVYADRRCFMTDYVFGLYLFI